MSGTYLLGIDVGTTGTKSVIFNTEGQLVSKGYEEYPVLIPRPGWAEQEPDVWWNATVKSIKMAMRKASISADDITCIGLSSQTNSPSFLDKDGKPLRPCILWMDMRAEPQAAWVREKVGEETIHKVTGVKIAPFYSYCKILWVKENQPEIYRKTKMILQPKDYIGFKLTGEYVLDVALASSSGFADIRRRSYAENLLEEIGLSVDKLPKLVSPLDVIGNLTKEAAKVTGLAENIPVVAGSGDVITNAVGSGVVKVGQAYNKIATASDIAVCVNRPIFDPKFRFVSYIHALPKKWILMAGSGEGICYRWFRDKFAQLEVEIAKCLNKNPYEIMDAEAQEAPPGSENLIFLPYIVGVRSPIWDSNARGIYFGISLNHDKRHFIRSIMEGIAYSVRHRMEIIEKEFGISIREIRVVGGGARSAVWRRIMADIYGKPIILPRGEEQECLGAVILAGLGIKLYKNSDEACKRLIPTVDKLKPKKENREKYEKLFRIYVGLYERVKDLFFILHQA
ncbi:MAG: xylulokinase [Candidatus Baldrarchaeia archaeon]